MPPDTLSMVAPFRQSLAGRFAKGKFDHLVWTHYRSEDTGLPGVALVSPSPLGLRILKHFVFA